MRIKLNIEHLPNQRLPMNYQYLISSWIYTILFSRDSHFAMWLHEHGYQFNGKKYKHFCFSLLKPKRFKIHQKERVFELVEGPTELILSFSVDKVGMDIIKGLFKDNMIQLSSGESFRFLGVINTIGLIKLPQIMNTMKFRTQTPTCLSIGEEGKKHPTFLNPMDERYAEFFIRNLINKANAYLGEYIYAEEQVKFHLLSKEVKSKLWRIKGIEIKGYLFEFSLSAPNELIEIGYHAGFGTQNSSLGMGLCNVIEIINKMERYANRDNKFHKNAV